MLHLLGLEFGNWVWKSPGIVLEFCQIIGGHPVITHYGLILCDIQVYDLQMEINQASGDQSV